MVGLQTALTLLSRNVNVTLISASWPGNLTEPHYTSMFSGAQWRSNPDINDQRQQKWDRATLLHWRHLVSLYSPTEIGLEIRPAEFYWDAPGPSYDFRQSHWWCEDEKLMPIRELDLGECAENGFPGGTGFSYETVAVNPELYCKWLLRQCENHAGGGRFETHTMRIGHFREVFEMLPGAKAVVNCTGVDAGKLVGDDSCFPTKGQTVLVQGRAHRLVTRRNETGVEPWEALVIPRPGERLTLLGGCKIPGNWSTEPDESITKMILDRCRPLTPELLDENGDFEVLAVRVGLRPSRKGGARVELESLEDGRLLIHNYGHHSAGFEGSVGVAEEVSSLLLDNSNVIRSIDLE